MTREKSIDLSLGASGTKYTAPADGWFQFAGKTNGANQYLRIYNATSKIEISFNLPAAGQTGKAFVPAKGGDTIVLNYNTTSNNALKFIYAVGSSPTV